MKILFICSANIQRSRLAALMMKSSGVHEAKSAGIKPLGSGKPITKELLAWADVVCYFEQKHLDHLKAKWFKECASKRMINLDIPDNIKRPAHELSALLQDRFGKIFSGTGGKS